MKRLEFIILISFLAIIQLPAQSLTEIKNLFYEAVKDPSSPEKYKGITDDLQTVNPLTNAYIGGLKTMMANTVSNPYKKMKYFNQGKNIIEKAVAENNSEWEIRFVRFMIQCKIPSFLFYDNIKEDKKIILEALHKNDSSDSYVKKIAIHFLSESGKLDNTELNSVKN